MIEQDTASEIIAEFGKLSADRGNEEAVWNQVAEYMMPAHKDTFGQSMRPKGAQNQEKIFDATAPIALSRFGAILDSLLTPRNQTWHRLLASDPVLNKNREVKLWFEDTNSKLFKYRYSTTANFSSQNLQNFMSLGSYGTGCVFSDAHHSGVGLRYRSIHLGEIYFDENHQGIIDKALRRFILTGRQAIQMFGAESLPKSIVERTAKNPSETFFFIHCVKPRSDVDPSRFDYKGMAFASYYVSEEGKQVVKEAGYNTFPYAVSRYYQAPGEIYGRSPAMDVLPAVKTLNEQKKTMLKQGHRTVDPTILVHDDGIADAFSMRPGAVVSGGVSADGRPLVHTLPVGRLDVGRDLMEDERMAINNAFLITLFQIMVESPQKTATEVVELAKEKGILLAPTVGRQQSEYLGPLIEREVDILSQQGLLLPMPKILREAKGEFRVEYDSPMSRAQRAEEASGVMRAVEHALTIVNVTQNPEPLDHFNWDKIIPTMAEIQAVPTSWMRSAEEVEELRARRAEAAEEDKAIQAAPAAAAMMKAAAVSQKG
jgi:hypothetical protein